MARSHKRRKGLSRRQKDLVFVLLMAFLPLLQFAIFYVGVNVNSVLLAFKSYSDQEHWSFVGLANFEVVFDDIQRYTLYKVALKNSALVFCIGTPISTFLSFIFSYYIYKSHTRFGDFMKMILFLPSIIPSIAMATIFVQVADSAIPKFWSMVFHQEILGLFQNPDLTIYTIIFYNIWVSFGVNVLLFLNAMGDISRDVVEAAEIDGAGFFREMWSITFPQCYGTVKTLLITSVGGFFVNTASIVSFYGTSAEESVYTVGYYLYKETVLNASSNASLPKLAALGLLLTIITIPAVYLVRYVLNRFDPNRSAA